MDLPSLPPSLPQFVISSAQTLLMILHVPLPPPPLPLPLRPRRRQSSSSAKCGACGVKTAVSRRTYYTQRLVTGSFSSFTLSSHWGQFRLAKFMGSVKHASVDGQVDNPRATGLNLTLHGNKNGTHQRDTHIENISKGNK